MSETGGWAQLEAKGWKKIYNDINKMTHYIRPGPNGKKVSQRRQLSNTEKEEIGLILFPAIRKNKNVTLVDIPLSDVSQDNLQGEVDIDDAPEVKSSEKILERNMPIMFCKSCQISLILFL